MNVRERMGRFARSMRPQREAERRIKTWRSSGIAPYPQVVWIEPTNECNLKCLKCPQAEGIGRPRRAMSIDEYRRVIGEISPFRPFVALHHTGEPLINREIFDMFAIARNAGLVTMMATNATLLHRDGFRIAGDGPDMLTFSIDAASAEDYSKLHPGVPWERIEKNVEGYFEAWKRAPNPTRTFLKVISGPINRAAVPDIVKSWSRYPFELVEVDEQYEWPVCDEERRFGPVRQGWKAFPCPAPWNWAAVLSDGKFVPCCYDALGRFDGGNIQEQSFDDIWRGEAMERLRNYIGGDESPGKIAPCMNCVFRRNDRPFDLVRRAAYSTMPLWSFMARYSRA